MYSCLQLINNSKEFWCLQVEKIYQADNEAAFKAQGYPIKVEIHSMPKPGR